LLECIKAERAGVLDEEMLANLNNLFKNMK